MDNYLEVVKLAWENSLHFLTTPLVSPQNDVAENECKNSILMKRPHPDLANASDELKQISLVTQVPIRGTTQIWLIKHY